MDFLKGQFGYDLDFLKKHINPVILSSPDHRRQIIIAPEYQGRIMTSTSHGLSGASYGWVNHELIGSKKIEKHINPFGGEDRFWLGPEAGQFGLFFNSGDKFIYENYQVPAFLDTEPFELISCDATDAEFLRKVSLVNYAGTEFNITINRKIILLDDAEIAAELHQDTIKELNMVVFESHNTITNTGSDWKRNTGLLSAWIIGVFNATDHTTIIIPVKDSATGINSNYFSTPDESRLQVNNNLVYFKGDGKYRSKIGITPGNTKPVCGSFDSENGVLTIVQFNFEKGDSYINSQWEIQKDPYNGDVINSYNDGPLDDRDKQLGGFYELETSSPAKELRTGESITHIHRTLHFQGDKKSLNEISMRLLNADISKLTSG